MVLAFVPQLDRSMMLPSLFLLSSAQVNSPRLRRIFYCTWKRRKILPCLWDQSGTKDLNWAPTSRSAKNNNNYKPTPLIHPRSHKFEPNGKSGWCLEIFTLSFFLMKRSSFLVQFSVVAELVGRSLCSPSHGGIIKTIWVVLFLMILLGSRALLEESVGSGRERDFLAMSPSRSVLIVLSPVMARSGATSMIKSNNTWNSRFGSHIYIYFFSLSRRSSTSEKGLKPKVMEFWRRAWKILSAPENLKTDIFWVINCPPTRWEAQIEKYYSPGSYLVRFT